MIDLNNPLILPEGAKIDCPGAWALTMAQYHSQICVGPSISASGLKTVWSHSPAAYYRDSDLNPKNWVCEEVDGKEVMVRVKREDRPHFSLGKAAHHLLLQGRAGFDREFIVRPEKWKDWRTDAAKDWRKEMQAAGLTILTDEELFNIAGMAKSLAADPLVKGGILDGFVERSLVWKDPETGVWLKSRPDAIPNDSGDYADLKTTVSVTDEAIDSTLGKFGYNMQGALVGTAAKEVLAQEMRTFSFVWVEKEDPWCVRITGLTAEDRNRGEQQNRLAIIMFAQAAASGQWIGPGSGQQDAEERGMPKWAADRIDKRIEILKATLPAPVRLP